METGGENCPRERELRRLGGGLAPDEEHAALAIPENARVAEEAAELLAAPVAPHQDEAARVGFVQIHIQTGVGLVRVLGAVPEAILVDWPLKAVLAEERAQLGRGRLVDEARAHVQPDQVHLRLHSMA